MRGPSFILVLFSVALSSSVALAQREEAVPADEPVAEEPVDEAALEQARLRAAEENDTVEQTPVQNTPVQNTPVQNTPVQNTPVQNTPVQDTTVPTTTVERPPLPPGAVYGGIALTLITVGVGTYFGVSALLIRDSEARRDPRFPPDTADIEESALVADVYFITAGVFAATTVALAFLTDWEREPEDGADEAGEEAEEDTDVVLFPQLGVGPELVMLGLVGQF